MTHQQMNISFAQQARDQGITKAITNADRVHNSWSERCYEYFKTFVRMQKGSFRIEEFRDWVENKIEKPPSLRAYGAITMKAARKGVIQHVGYAKVTNVRAHQANCAVWKRG